jgi:hypothetical protein
MFKETQWRTVSLVPRNDSELQRQISEDPIGKACECREQIEKLEEGYQRGLYAALGVAYAIAWHLERHWEDWVAFVNDPFFLCFKKRPKPKKHRGEILLYVMYFVFDARSKQRRDRAWKYARALSIYNNEGVPSAEVAAKIEEDGGVERLCARAIKEQPRRRKHEASEGYFVLDDEEVSGKPEAPSVAANEGEGEPDNVLEVEMRPEDLDRVLRLSKGKKARITVKRIPGDDWQRIIATRVRFLD